MTLRAYAGGAAEQRALEAWRIASARGFLNDINRERLWQKQNGRCYLCAQPFSTGNYNRGRDLNARTRDHVFPRRAGGGGMANILLACRFDNQAKGDRWPYPCEVIYLAAVYAEPFSAMTERARREHTRKMIALKRRAKFDRYDA